MDLCFYDNLSVFENWTLLKTINDERAQQFSPVIAYLSVLLIVGVLGNSLVIYIYGSRFKRTATTYFVIWLAILDLLTCVLGLPFEIADVRNNAYFTSAAICKIARFIQAILIMASVLCLLVVAFDRYYKVCKPHHRSPVGSLKKVVAGTIVISLFCTWPAIFVFGIDTSIISVDSGNYSIKGQTCSFDSNTHAVIIQTYWIILGLIFIVSSGFMITVYSLLVCSLYKRHSGMAVKRKSQLVDHASESSQSSKNRKSTGLPANARTKIKRTTRVFVAITAIFILSFLPLLVLVFLGTVKPFCEQTVTSTVVYMIFIRSKYINNVANPFLYGFLNPRFRQECQNSCFRCHSFSGDSYQTRSKDQSNSIRTPSTPESSHSEGQNKDNVS